jgi:hypothetical protein
LPFLFHSWLLLSERSLHSFHLFLKDTQFQFLPMQSFVISPDGRTLRWTCTSCQHDNFFATNSLIYPERVKWRCDGCKTTAIVYRPDKWIEEAMLQYMSIHRDGQRAKWPRSDDKQSDGGSERSVPGNHINVCSTALAEGPDFTCRGHVVDEKPDHATTGSAFDVHFKDSILLLEKS